MSDRLRRELAIPLGNAEIAHVTVPSPMSDEEWRLLTSILAAMRAGLVREMPKDPGPDAPAKTGQRSLRELLRDPATTEELAEPGWRAIEEDG